MMERLILGILGDSVIGGLSIIILCFLSWLFRGKYGARSRKNGWLLIAVCLLLPLYLFDLPHMHTVQLPNLVIRETQENALHTENSAQQTGQENDTDMADAIQNEQYKAEISTEKVFF